MDKRIIILIFLLTQVALRSIGNGRSQTSILFTNNLSIGNYSITGIGYDSTMSGSTSRTLIASLPIKQYVDSAVHPININLALLNADTAANHLNVIKFYNKGGLVSHQMKIWADTVTPSTANGYSANISSAGFSVILSVQATIFQNSSTAATIPIVSGKAFTTSASIINIQTSNSGILGILTGLIFATSLTGMTLHLVVIGY